MAMLPGLSDPSFWDPGTLPAFSPAQQGSRAIPATSRHVAPRLRVWVAAALVAVALLSGCTGGDGALQSIDVEGARACSPQGDGGRAVIGVSGFENKSDRQLIVTALDLISADRLVLIGGQVLDAADPSAHYVGDDFTTWGPTPFKETTIAPGATVYVKVGVQAEGSGGSADGIRVTYLDMGGELRVDSRIAMMVVASGQRCGAA